MTNEEFIEKIRHLDPIHKETYIDLETLYDHIVIVVQEFERLEDLEDTTIELMAHIDKLQEELKEARDNLYSANQVVSELIDGDHIPKID